MNILWKRFSDLLQEYHTTIYAVQKATKMSQGSLNKWENLSSRPSAESVLQVARHFDVSVDYLLGNTDNPHSHKNDSINIPPAVEAVLQVLDRLDGVSTNTITATSEARNDIKNILGTYHLGIAKDNSVVEDMLSTVDDEKA